MTVVKDINLTPVQDSHLELIMNWRNSEEVAKYMYTEDKITLDKQKIWWDRTKNSTSSKYWMIEFEGKLLGVANLADIKQTHKSCLWAFYLGDNSVRGQGIGSKVEYNVLKHVFEEMNFNKLCCEVLVENDKVIKMHEGFGFKREAHFRDHIFKNEKFHDVVGLSMLKSEWEAEKDNLYDKVYNGK